MAKQPTGTGFIIGADEGGADGGIRATLANFDIDGDELKPEHTAFLDARIVPLLRITSDKGLSATGSASDSPPEARNPGLADRRAQAVLSYVIGKGIAEVRTWLGESTTAGGQDAATRTVSVQLAPTYDPALDAEMQRLNGLPMTDLLAELTKPSHARLTSLRAHIGQAKGVNVGRLMVALDAVMHRDSHVSEWRAVIAAEAQQFLQLEVDQRQAVDAFMNAKRVRPAAASFASASVGPKVTYTLSTNDAVLVRASDKMKRAEVKEPPDTYVRAILRRAGFDDEAWFKSFTKASFLGRAIGDPIHTDLAEHLASVEKTFADMFGGGAKSAVEAGKTLGLVEGIGGSRHYPSSAAISMHLFGLAIDVNYAGDPFIGQDKDEAKELLRIGQLVHGDEKSAYRNNMSYDELLYLDETVEAYFSYLDDTPALEARLAAAQGAPWKGKSVDDAKKIILDDLDQLARQWGRSNAKDVVKKTGFLNLKRDLVVGIGLSWGAAYGDMMHFDMRNKGSGAKIQAMLQQYLKEKEAEAAAAWAKANP
jgi:hypothetical protein